MTGPALPPPEPDRMATPARPPGGGRPIVVGAGFHSDGSRPHLCRERPRLGRERPHEPRPERAAGGAWDLASAAPEAPTRRLVTRYPKPRRRELRPHRRMLPGDATPAM